MATPQDFSIGFGPESLYGTGVVPSRFLESAGDETLDIEKTVTQSQNLRVGARVASSRGRLITRVQGGGDVPLECQTKGQGLWWKHVVGAGTATEVSTGLYQHVFTFADLMPSMTLQKGSVYINDDGSFTIDPITFLGTVCTSFSFDFGQELAKLTASMNARDVTTATEYAEPSYAEDPDWFQFANASLFTGTYTAPTATGLASGSVELAGVRSGSLSVDHNLNLERDHLGSGGRKERPVPAGLKAISGSLEVEYRGTTFRDAVMDDEPMLLIVDYTAGTTDRLQLVVPEIKFGPGGLPRGNGGGLAVQSLSFDGLDNRTAAHPFTVVMRTVDAAP